MLQSDLDARVILDHGSVLQGLVSLRFFAGEDPWLVHVGFFVANLEHKMQVERHTLMHACNILAEPDWFSPEGSFLRFAVGPAYCRFRIMDDGGEGSIIDFDVDRQELMNFMEQTQALADYQAEQAALDAVIEQELRTL